MTNEKQQLAEAIEQTKLRLIKQVFETNPYAYDYEIPKGWIPTGETIKVVYREHRNNGRNAGYAPFYGIHRMRGTQTIASVMVFKASGDYFIAAPYNAQAFENHGQIAQALGNQSGATTDLIERSYGPSQEGILTALLLDLKVHAQAIDALSNELKLPAIESANSSMLEMMSHLGQASADGAARLLEMLGADFPQELEDDLREEDLSRLRELQKMNSVKQ